MVAALRRFIARRGIPSQIVFDNATNFMGARRDLNEQEKVDRGTTIQHHWLALHSSSLGLWEAAVKSMKHHLHRVMDNSLLNYEDRTTILCQKEQVLNNRPLLALTNNPDYIFAITPSMLANGSQLDAIRQPRLQKMDDRGDPVKWFRSLQQLLSQYWKRWSSEYVASLQPRAKRRQERVNLSVDDVGLIRDDGFPPLQWSIGQVMQLKLGHDGLARVALMRTSRGEFTRPVSKLRRLPVKDNELHKANVERHAHKK